ncbi:MAG: flagellar filament capping protein FliD [Rhodocyclales bacterium]|nr:flagellar filament capping protein FliD [Rhodocyclales bacterium]
MAVSSTSTSYLSNAGTLTSSGLGSGLDVTGIVSKLMAIERQPIGAIDGKIGVIDAKLTAYGTLKGTLSSFQTAVQTLTTTSTFNATTATVADTTQFSATSSSTAALGTYDIRVQQLAKAQKLQSVAFSNLTDSVGTGSLTFDFGTYTTTGDVTSFAENTDKNSVTVSIPSGSDSLSAVANAINSARVGVSASVINDGTSYYLAFSSSDPGADNALRITVDDDDGDDTNTAGLSRLAYNKASGYANGSLSYTGLSLNVAAASNNNQFNIAVDGGAVTTITLDDNTYTSANIVAAMQAKIDAVPALNGTVSVQLDASNQLKLYSKTSAGYSAISLTPVAANSGLETLFGTTTTSEATARRLTQTVAPQDAIIWVDNVQITKSTNTITDAISGITLSLAAESATATTLTVTGDTSKLKTGIETFVTEYNKVSALLTDLLAYDVSTGEAGALQGESTVRSVQSQLRGAMRTVLGGLSVSSLSDLGVETKKDGTLSIDSTTLDDMLADATNDFSDFFIGSTNAPGMAASLDDTLDAMLNSGGLLSTKTDGLNQTISEYDDRKAALEVRMAAIENRYRTQFTNLDALIASMNSTSQYLTQQLANLPSIGDNNSN